MSNNNIAYINGEFIISNKKIRNTDIKILDCTLWIDDRYKLTRYTSVYFLLKFEYNNKVYNSKIMDNDFLSIFNCSIKRNMDKYKIVTISFIEEIKYNKQLYFSKTNKKVNIKNVRTHINDSIEILGLHTPRIRTNMVFIVPIFILVVLVTNSQYIGLPTFSIKSIIFSITGTLLFMGSEMIWHLIQVKHNIKNVEKYISIIFESEIINNDYAIFERMYYAQYFVSCILCLLILLCVKL